MQLRVPFVAKLHIGFPFEQSKIKVIIPNCGKLYKRGPCVIGTIKTNKYLSVNQRARDGMS